MRKGDRPDPCPPYALPLRITPSVSRIVLLVVAPEWVVGVGWGVMDEAEEGFLLLSLAPEVMEDAPETDGRRVFLEEFLLEWGGDLEQRGGGVGERDRVPRQRK